MCVVVVKYIWSQARPLSSSYCFAGLQLYFMDCRSTVSSKPYRKTVLYNVSECILFYLAIIQTTADVCGQNKYKKIKK